MPNWNHMNLLHRGVRNSIVNGGGSVAASVQILQVESNAATALPTGDDAFADVTGATLSGLTSGDLYLCMAGMVWDSSVASKNDCYMRMAQDGVEIPNSVMRTETAPGNGSGDSGTPYDWAGTFTSDGSTVTIQEAHDSSESGFVGRKYIYLINLTDLGSSNYEIGVSTTPVATTTTDTYIDTPTIITVGDGSSDYLFVAGHSHSGFAAGASGVASVSILEGATQRTPVVVDTEDVADIPQHCQSYILDGIASTEFKFSVKTSFQTGTPSIDYQFMIAIKLNAFKEYHFTQELTNDVASFNTSPIPDEYVEHTYATVEAGDYHAFSGHLVRAAGSNIFPAIGTYTDQDSAGQVLVSHSPTGPTIEAHSATTGRYSLLGMSAGQTLVGGEEVKVQDIVGRGTVPASEQWYHNYNLYLSSSLA